MLTTVKHPSGVIIPRVSSREQESGYSISSQEKLLVEYAEKKGIKVVKIFSISESANAKSQRKIFNEIMQFVKRRKIKNIIFEKTDRCTRNFKDMVMLDYWMELDEDNKLHLVKDSLIMHRNSRSQEKLNWGLRVLFTKNYVDNLSEEVKKGQKEKIAQGWLPTCSPLGYTMALRDNRKIHVIDDEKSPYMKKAFKLYALGDYSLQTLCDLLYNEGLRSRKGCKVSKSLLAKNLSNPFYCGKLVWNGEIYPGKQEPLISEELFDKVQEILKGKTKVKLFRHVYLFKGLCTCKECGGLITWEKQKGHLYGRCNHYNQCTQKIYYKEPELEQKVFRALDKLQIKNTKLQSWITKALKESHKDQIVYREKTKEDLMAEIKRLVRRMDRLYDDKLDELIDEDFYRRKYKNLKEEKENIEKSLNRHNSADNAYFDLGAAIYDLCQKGALLYQKSDQNNKRKLLKLIFKDLVLKDGNLEVTYSDSFKFIQGFIQTTNTVEQSLAKELEKSTLEPSNMACTSAPDDIRSTWLAEWNNFRTFKWVLDIKFPNLLMEELATITTKS